MAGFVSAVAPYWLAGDLIVAPITRTPDSRAVMIGTAARGVEIAAPDRTVHVMED